MEPPNTSTDQTEQIRTENFYKNSNVSQIKKRQIEIMSDFINMSYEIFVSTGKEVRGTETGNDADPFKKVTRRRAKNRVWHTGNAEVRDDNEKLGFVEKDYKQEKEYAYF